MREHLIGDGRRTRLIFDFIVDFLEAHSYAPSTRQIGAGVGIRSTGVIHYHINKLIEAGFLERPRPRVLVVTGGEFSFYGDRPE